MCFRLRDTWCVKAFADNFVTLRNQSFDRPWRCSMMLCGQWPLVTLTMMKILVRLIATRSAQLIVRAPVERQKQRRASAFGKVWKWSPTRTCKLWKRDSVWTEDDGCLLWGPLISERLNLVKRGQQTKKDIDISSCCHNTPFTMYFVFSVDCQRIETEKFVLWTNWGVGSAWTKRTNSFPQV